MNTPSPRLLREAERRAEVLVHMQIRFDARDIRHFATVFVACGGCVHQFNKYDIVREEFLP